MNKTIESKFKIGDYIKVIPYGCCPVHFCQIREISQPLNGYPKTQGYVGLGSMWYSYEGNAVESNFHEHSVELATKEEYDKARQAFKDKQK